MNQEMLQREEKSLTFEQLVVSIRDVHGTLSAHASKAVNISLTLRNWLIGCYIREYEQNGTDRAQYGERLLDDLALRLQSEGMKRVAARELRRYRQFYLVYPQIGQSVTPEFRNLLPDRLLEASSSIRESVTPESRICGIDNQLFVSKYQLELPSKEDMQRFLEREIARSGIEEDDSKTGRLVRELREKYMAEVNNANARSRTH